MSIVADTLETNRLSKMRDGRLGKSRASRGFAQVDNYALAAG